MGRVIDVYVFKKPKNPVNRWTASTQQPNNRRTTTDGVEEEANEREILVRERKMS